LENNSQQLIKGDYPIDAAYSIAMDPKGQEGANWLYAGKKEYSTKSNYPQIV
jgi:hypothetical protein